MNAEFGVRITEFKKGRWILGCHQDQRVYKRKLDELIIWLGDRKSYAKNTMMNT